MDFNDNLEEAAFREKARSWLVENIKVHKESSGLDDLQRAKIWQKRKYDAGWACIRWPQEYGGRNASAMEQVIWNQEEARFDLPTGVFAIGQGIAAPTMMSWASEEDKVKHLPPLASGKHVWCQLFSEPAGGSDLAALRTRAEKDGDEWVINGQKTWTSGAHYSDYGILVVRTDPTVPKHKGLTYFFVDMKSPGIKIKPIKQIVGGANFNEVFFTDVRISDNQRLGAVGQGWQVAITTLMNERAAIGSGGLGVGFDEVFKLATRIKIDDRPAIEDPQVRAKLAEWYCQESGLRFTAYRSMSALSRGEIPGPENSIGKYVGASKTQDMASFAMDLLELSGALWDSEHGEESGIYASAYMGAPGMRIAGGSDEIMLNILAERVLGMPQDVRLDKGIPFNEIPTGSN
jgi:acyl-CoA dehydrogenase